MNHLISCNAISHNTHYSHAVDSILIIYESITYLSISTHVQSERSALQLASENGHLKVVKFLLEKGVSIHDKDKVRYISS